MRKYYFLLFSLVGFISCANESIPKNATPNEILSESTQSAMVQKGKVLFSTNCKICHSTVATLGPVLENIQAHWPNKKNLNKYIKNAPAMMQQNERSKKVYQEWKDKPQMPAFTGLSIDEIDCIIEYLYTST